MGLRREVETDLFWVEVWLCSALALGDQQGERDLQPRQKSSEKPLLGSVGTRVPPWSVKNQTLNGRTCPALNAAGLQLAGLHYIGKVRSYDGRVERLPACQCCKKKVW